MSRTSFLTALVLAFSLLTGMAHGQEPEAAQATVININSADVTTLVSLDGIGESKARAIIEYRETHGPFASIEDLAQVKGIGVRTVEKNADRLTVK